MCGRIRVQPGEHTLLPYYQDSAKRALLKPEAVFEIESGLKLSGFDITAASLVRTEWYQSVRRLFERYDYVVAPTAQLFPFDVNMHWPNEIAGRRMETYHEWMKGMVLVTMSGCPALAVPAGFSDQGLPIGIQIVAPAHAYDVATNWVSRRHPPLLNQQRIWCFLSLDGAMSPFATSRCATTALPPN